MKSEQTDTGKHEADSLTTANPRVLNYPHDPPQPSALRHETSVPALCPAVRLLALSASVKRDLGSVCSHDVSSSLLDTEPTSNKRELFLLAEVQHCSPSAGFLYELSTFSSSVYICPYPSSSPGTKGVNN